MAKVKDVWSNKAYGTVTESAANTLTFAEIQTNVNIFDKVAWIINRIEWYLDILSIALLTGGNDMIQMGLTASDNITGLDLNNPSVIDMEQLSIFAWAGGAGTIAFDMPLIRDFSGLPGGGLIVAPRPLYLGIEAGSLATPATAAARIYFQQKILAADEYLELVDFYRIVS